MCCVLPHLWIYNTSNFNTLGLLPEKGITINEPPVFGIWINGQQLLSLLVKEYLHVSISLKFWLYLLSLNRLSQMTVRTQKWSTCHRTNKEQNTEYVELLLLICFKYAIELINPNFKSKLVIITKTWTVPIYYTNLFFI